MAIVREGVSLFKTTGTSSIDSNVFGEDLMTSGPPLGDNSVRVTVMIDSKVNFIHKDQATSNPEENKLPGTDAFTNPLLL